MTQLLSVQNSISGSLTFGFFPYDRKTLKMACGIIILEFSL